MSDSTPPPSLLTVPEVAAFLRTTAEVIYNKISQGKLPGVVKHGRRVLVHGETLRRELGIPSRGAKS